MDRQAHEYAAAMAFAQQQQQQASMQQQQQFGFHPQPQQFPHQVHAQPFLPPHPSLQQIPPYHRHVPQQQQLYPHHHHPLLHLQQQQQSPPTFAPHPPPHLMSPSPYMHPFDSAPPLAVPPSDPELHKRIDKLVEYAAKNGPEFEAMIREKQQDNPAYSFLFGGEGHNYYRYKLWLSTRPAGSAFNPSFPSSSVPMMPSSHNPMLNPSPLNPPPMGAGGAPGSMMGTPQLHQPYPPYYDQHQQPPHSQPFMGQARADYEPSTRSFKGLSGPLPSDVAAELNSVLSNLTGTKESIKGAKMWFMQRSPFAPALAEALRDRIFALDDSERQLHIIFLANDILFDSLQRRMNPQDLDNEALAFKPVLGSMLARIYDNPHNKDSNQSRLEKILQFWASKEVYNKETIAILENEMTGGAPLRSTTLRDASDPSGTSPNWIRFHTLFSMEPRWKGKGFADIAHANPMSEIVTQLQGSLTQSKTYALLSGCDILLEVEPELAHLLSKASFGRAILTSNKDKQWFQLGPEEAFYLCHALQCLTVSRDKETSMSEMELWDHFRAKREAFPEFYKVYLYLRSKNWIVCPGIQYGVDYVAYRHHPALVHSEYAVLVVSDGDDNISSGRLRVWSDLYCTLRVCGFVAKTLLVLIIRRYGSDRNSLNCLEEFIVEERTITRWVPERCREDQRLEEPPGVD